ncbi:MAG: hypothetical protein IPJ21_17985 [Sterolibacteriaceae bacterium]|nr:hypothetical protein [Sterolibacteriaceae bacterium]
MRRFEGVPSFVRLFAGLVLAASLTLPGSGGAQSVALSLGSIDAGVLRIDDLRLDLADLRGGPADLSIARLVVAEREWRKVTARCERIDLTREGIRCDKGEIAVPAADSQRKPLLIPLRFNWRSATGTFDAAIEPAAGEIWRVSRVRSGGVDTVRLFLDRADVGRLQPLLPALKAWQFGGTVSGETSIERGPRETSVRAKLMFDAARFADASGAHAGEKIAGMLNVDARHHGSRWSWQCELTWPKGEMYWAPFYLASPGVAASASGSFDGAQVAVEALRIEGASLGLIEGRGSFDLPSKRIGSASFSTGMLDLAQLAPSLIAPLLESVAGPKLIWSGQASLAGEIRDNALESVNLALHGVGLREAGGHYALEGIEADIPWRSDASTDARIDIARATWGKLPIGPIALPLKLRGQAVRLFQAKIPLLDGEIVLDDVRYTRGAERTSWRAAIAVTPVSMERLTEALGWPRMSGIFSASIPGIRQDGSTIALDGALVVQVFDGFASVTDLKLIEPFGRVPRLFADVELRNLDLEMLTRTFSFGSISGRIDGDLDGLELAGLRPLRFDARIESSPGDYRKRISQRAVQNISALGGAGAAAAIQRSVLRVFEEFSYGKLGLRCVLRDSLCTMGGIEPADNGYVIVKGAGIPAISVIGYNRRVDWDELLARLKRVTEGNMKPVVK